MKPAPRLPDVLLVEPQFVMRRTMVAVAREMAIAELHEATSVSRALPLLSVRAFRGLVLDMGDGGEGLALLAQLRAGGFACHADMPVVALTFSTTDDEASRLEALRPLRTLPKPFKVGELLRSVALMGPR